MTRKPRILLIPNVGWWIIGEMGKQIIARFGEKYDFYFVPEGLFERRADLLRTLVASVDAIHCLNESSIGLFKDFAPAALPPIVTWIHHVTHWSSDHQMAIDRSVAIVVCTNGWKQYLEKRVEGRIPVILVPHGVDATFFRRRKVDRKRFGIPDGRFVLGFIGAKASDSDGGRKGTDVFLDVIGEAALRLPSLHVLLGGPGWEVELENLAKQGISASAAGYIRKSDLPDLYSALDAYLLTSRIEGGPCTVFEAMACETSVVSTRVGAVPELIVDGVNGYSADVDDREALLSAVVTLGHSPDKRNEIARRGRETVSDLPWARVLAPLEGVYDELLQQRASRELSQPGPAWMDDPRGLLRASCAADALGNVIPRVRKRSISPGKGLELLLEMMNRQCSLIDIVKGVAMVKGWSFTAGPELRETAGPSNGSSRM